MHRKKIQKSSQRGFRGGVKRGFYWDFRSVFNGGRREERGRRGRGGRREWARAKGVLKRSFENVFERCLFERGCRGLGKEERGANDKRTNDS